MIFGTLVFIFFMAISILITGSIFIGVDYRTHISMVKSSTKEYGKTNYNIFLQEFNKCKWDVKRYKGSLFDKSTNSEIHASIIQFNGIGMIMQNQIEYLKMRFHLYQYLKEINKEEEVRVNYVWKEEVNKL